MMRVMHAQVMRNFIRLLLEEACCFSQPDCYCFSQVSAMGIPVGVTNSP